MGSPIGPLIPPSSLIRPGVSPSQTTSLEGRQVASGTELASTLLPSDEAVTPPSEPAKPVEREALTQALQQLNEQAKGRVEFSVDEDSGVSVVRVVDSESGDVLRQMPSEAMLKIAQRLVSQGNGLITDTA